jgi:hypothetical protein
MKIRRVKNDPDDLTLSLPSAILPGLNADFDGDELNQIALPLKELAQLMKGFDPTEMTINRVDGSIRLDISALENCTLAIFSDN